MYLPLLMIGLGSFGVLYCLLMAVPALKAKSSSVRAFGCSLLSHGSMFGCFFFAGLIKVSGYPRELWYYYTIYAIITMIWSIYNLHRLNREIS